MTRIKKCPFCGEPPVVCLKHGDMYNVSCETVDCCGENDLWWETEQEAIEAWNTRYEPTCSMYEATFMSRTGDHVGTEYECSECKSRFGVKWRFCPSCGRRVIEE